MVRCVRHSNIIELIRLQLIMHTVKILSIRIQYWDQTSYVRINLVKIIIELYYSTALQGTNEFKLIIKLLSD